MGDKPQVCAVCGNTGTGEDPAGWYPEYVGGRGYVWKFHCADSFACWDRWNVRNGFPTFEEARVQEEKRERLWEERNGDCGTQH